MATEQQQRQQRAMRRLNQAEIDDLFAMAARGGGLAQAIAITDCVAQGPDQLQYMEGDTLVVLREAGGDQLLAYCEGEVGWVTRSNIIMDGPLASSSKQAINVSSHIVAVDTHTANSFRSSHSTISAQSPHTPCDIHSPSSTVSSQSAAKSWASMPGSPQSVAAAYTSAIRADSCSPDLAAGRPVHAALGMSPKRPVVQLTLNGSPNGVTDTTADALAPSHPFNPKSALGRRLAPPPQPASGNVTGTTAIQNSNRHSVSSIGSDDSAIPIDSFGETRELPYTRSPYAHSQPDERDTSARVAALPATISVSALGVYSRPTLAALPRSEAVSTATRTRVASNARHVEHRAGHLAILTEPIYRQSYAAETARVSMVPTELSYTEDPLDEEDDREPQSPISDDDSPSNGFCGIRRSGALARIDLTIDSAVANNTALPSVDDVAYPLTPGLFGLGEATKEQPAAPEQEVSTVDPSPPSGQHPFLTPVLKVPLKTTDAGTNEVEQVSFNAGDESLRSSRRSSKDDQSNYEPSASEETILSTPQTFPIGSFADSPPIDSSPYLNAGPRDPVEVVHPDASMTDPLPPQKQFLQPSILSDKPTKLFPRSPTTSSLSVMPDSPTSVNSHGSVESRGANKPTNRGGIYALGHAPQLTESQQQSLRHLSASAADKTSSIAKAPSLRAASEPPHHPPAQSPIQPHSLSTSSPSANAPDATPSAPVLTTLPTSLSKLFDEPLREPSGSRAAETPASSHVAARAPTITAVGDAPLRRSVEVNTFPPPIPQRRRPIPGTPTLHADGREDGRSVLAPRPGARQKSATLPEINRHVSPMSTMSSQRPPRPPPSIVTGRPNGHNQRVTLNPGEIVGPQHNLHRPLVRRVTAPTISTPTIATSSVNDSSHAMKRPSPRPAGPAPNLLPEMRWRSSPGSSEDNHSSSSHTHELHRSALPTRTTSSSSEDNHGSGRLVSLPSDLFQMSRQSPLPAPVPPKSAHRVSPSSAVGEHGNHVAPTVTPSPVGPESKRQASGTPPPPHPRREGSGSTQPELKREGSGSMPPQLRREPSESQLRKDSFGSIPWRDPFGSLVRRGASGSRPELRREGSGSVSGDHRPSLDSTISTQAPTVYRSRSRSFSAALTKSLRKNSRRNQPVLSIDTTPPMPGSRNDTEELVGPQSAFERSQPRPGFLRTHSNGSSISDFGSLSIRTSNDSGIALPWLSHSRSMSSPKSATSTSSFRPAVSHRDYADPTVSADGMEFEIIKPQKLFNEPPMVRVAVDSSDLGLLSRSGSVHAESVARSSTESPPELDEWGFIKLYSPTPEIFKSRQSPGEVRAAEQKWLSIIQQPLGYRQSAPKKVRRMVIEQGVPASLRGRVWGWFMSNGMSGRVDGLFGRLLSNEPGTFDEQIDADVKAVYSDHSAFYGKDSPGQADLRTLLRAYVLFAPSGYRTDIARLAGALLIHAPLEDAFWLLAGLFNGVLKSYYVLDTKAFVVDLNVFGGILEGSERGIGKLFRQAGVLPEHYLVKWWSGMFIRSLPWPTVLRLMDAIVSEGPRYLMIASLALLTLSRDRLFALPRTREAIVEYLTHLPQDSLLLPETFMRACDQVKLRDEDLKKLRLSVKGQLASKA